MKVKTKRCKLNPKEMAFRKVYFDLLKDEKITTVFRPDKRVCGDFRGYCRGQIVTARVINRVGLDQPCIPPKFIRGFSKKIEIVKVEAKPLKKFTTKDFVGSSPDIFNQQSLRYHLGLIYNLPPSQLKVNALITKIQFSYLKN